MIMTREQAKAIMEQIGCMDVRNVSCLHIAYMHYIDRLGRGLAEKLPIPEAYAVLTAKEDEPVVKQASLFEEKGADL